MNPVASDTKLDFAKFRRQLEKDIRLNLQLCLGVTVLWCILALFASISTIDGAVIILLLTGGYHLFLSWLVLRHIFNYGRAKATDFNIFRRWIRDYWLWYGIGLIALLFCYSVHFWFGTLASLIGGAAAMRRLKTELAVEYESGTRPMPFAWLQDEYGEKKAPGDPGIFFGGLLLPTSEANTHLKLVGTNGSGKTNLLRLMMQSVLPRLEQDHHGRALVYDPKAEFMPILVGMGIDPQRIHILNPFDNRAATWDLAKDLTRDRDAVALAALLLPEKEGKGGDNEFFDKAARRIISGVTKFFMRTAPDAWTLRDLVLAAQHVELVAALLTQDKQLARNLTVLGAGNTAGNVLSTIAAYIGDALETVAAYCDYHLCQGRTFTLKDWYAGNDILLLGNDRESDATLKPYNQLLFTRASQMLLSGYASESSMTYLILDELPSLGRLGEIETVARMARSYGGSLIIAFQAYTDLEKVYGKELANSLIGQFDKSAYLRAKDFQTAEWASKQIGHMKTMWKPRTRGWSQGQTLMSGSRNESYSQQKETDPVVRPEDIMNLPKPDRATGKGVQGFYRVDQYFYSHEVSSAYLSTYMAPQASHIQAYEAAPDIAEELRLWDDEDIYRLGIQQVLAAFQPEQMKTLPIEDWVQLPGSQDISLLLAELSSQSPSEEDKELSRDN